MLKCVSCFFAYLLLSIMFVAFSIIITRVYRLRAPRLRANDLNFNSRDGQILGRSHSISKYIIVLVIGKSRMCSTGYICSEVVAGVFKSFISKLPQHLLTYRFTIGIQ